VVVGYLLIDSGLGWDDNCEGLVQMHAREEEWKEREHHNDTVQWGVKATGWEVTPPASLVPRADAAGAGIWPVTAGQLAQASTWPTEEEYLAKQVQVEVSIEVHLSVGELIREHTACRLLSLFILIRFHLTSRL
jgi:hypothetical protein